MIQVVPALRQHAETIAQFQCAMAYETENLQLHLPTVRMGVQAVFDDASKGAYFVALHNDQVVACLLTTFEWSDWRNSQVMWIQSLYVLPDYRKQRVFNTMYQHLKQLVLQSNTYAGIRLYVDKTNQRAMQVYGAVGMNGEHYQVFEWMR